jgi:hypothetical protein
MSDRRNFKLCPRAPILDRGERPSADHAPIDFFGQRSNGFACPVPELCLGDATPVSNRFAPIQCSGWLLAGFLNAYLTDADLHYANLRGAHLRAHLKRANLHDADLRNADRTGADLTGADLTGAFLMETKLDGACGRDVEGLDKQLEPCPGEQR